MSRIIAGRFAKVMNDHFPCRYRTLPPLRYCAVIRVNPGVSTPRIFFKRLIMKYLIALLLLSSATYGQSRPPRVTESAGFRVHNIGKPKEVPLFPMTGFPQNIKIDMDAGEGFGIGKWNVQVSKYDTNHVYIVYGDLSIFLDGKVYEFVREIPNEQCPHGLWHIEPSTQLIYPARYKRTCAKCGKVEYGRQEIIWDKVFNE